LFSLIYCHEKISFILCEAESFDISATYNWFSFCEITWLYILYNSLFLINFSLDTFIAASRNSIDIMICWWTVNFFFWSSNNRINTMWLVIKYLCQSLNLFIISNIPFINMTICSSREEFIIIRIPPNTLYLRFMCFFQFKSNIFRLNSGIKLIALNFILMT